MGTSQANVSGEENTCCNVRSSARIVELIKNLALLSQIFFVILDLKNFAMAWSCDMTMSVKLWNSALVKTHCVLCFNAT